MNRRNFLLLRKDPEPRTFELSCERLYMQCLDAHLTDGDSEDDPADAADTSIWGGEPPARFLGPSRDQLFEALDLELRQVDVLRIASSQWLVGDLRDDFDRLMDGFRARGGRVEIRG